MSAESVALRAPAGHAPAARLLAHWWSRPTPDEVELWASCWPGAREAAELLGLDCGDVEALRSALPLAAGAELLAEYERLLNGPGRAPCPRCESMWRGDGPTREQGRLMGPAASDIVRVYRRIGLQVRADAHELPDHLAIEWEALAFAFERDASEAAASLVDEHLALWVPQFCEAVAGETAQPFYAALASLTAAWSAALSG